jgi:hypothetical protein
MMAVAIRNSFFLCYVLFQFWAMLNHYALDLLSEYPLFYYSHHCIVGINGCGARGCATGLSGSEATISNSLLQML